MLTLFATPKPFVGHHGVIQRNAIISWTRLQPKPEIILIGAAPGTAAIAAEFDLIHQPTVACNEFGTPLVNALFDQAQAIGQGDQLMYINADIILLSDVVAAIAQIPFPQFMMTGQRWNLDITALIDFTQAAWEPMLREAVATTGKREGAQAMDYFVFSPGLYPAMPPFAIGRPAWDNWLLYESLRLGVPVIDGSEAILAIHQNHDYNHHPQGHAGVWRGAEAQISRQLVGAWNPAIFRLEGAPYCLNAQGLGRPKLSFVQRKNCLLMQLILQIQVIPAPDWLRSWLITGVNVIHQAPGALRKRLAPFGA
jgi:hypothetical protein